MITDLPRIEEMLNDAFYQVKDRIDRQEENNFLIDNEDANSLAQLGLAIAAIRGSSNEKS